MPPDVPTTKLVKIAGKAAADVCRGIEMSPDGMAAIAGQSEAEACLRALVARECWADAAKFLAHALPKREAVWWGILVARSQLGEPAPPEAVTILAAAERWVRQPTDEHRRALFELAQPNLGDPAGFVGMAAFMSGGSLAPPGVQEVPPAEHLTGAMIGGAVMLAALAPDPATAASKYRGFLDKGMEIARGPAR